MICPVSPLVQKMQPITGLILTELHVTTSKSKTNNLNDNAR